MWPGKPIQHINFIEKLWVVLGSMCCFSMAQGEMRPDTVLLVYYSNMPAIVVYMVLDGSMVVWYELYHGR